MCDVTFRTPSRLLRLFISIYYIVILACWSLLLGRNESCCIHLSCGVGIEGRKVAALLPANIGHTKWAYKIRRLFNAVNSFLLESCIMSIIFFGRKSTPTVALLGDCCMIMNDCFYVLWALQIEWHLSPA